jgi:hypothetical protein
VLSAVTASATTTERIVANRFSGLAIDGFDPVAYFVDREALAGLPDFEAWQGGGGVALPQRRQPRLPSWPIPRSMVRNSAVTTRPMWRVASRWPAIRAFFAVVEERLFLFSREESRDAFRGRAGTLSVAGGCALALAAAGAAELNGGAPGSRRRRWDPPRR